jgi:hypothetical protein
VSRDLEPLLCRVTEAQLRRQRDLLASRLAGEHLGAEGDRLPLGAERDVALLAGSGSLELKTAFVANGVAYSCGTCGLTLKPERVVRSGHGSRGRCSRVGAGARSCRVVRCAAARESDGAARRPPSSMRCRALGGEDVAERARRATRWPPLRANQCFRSDVMELAAPASLVH